MSIYPPVAGTNFLCFLPYLEDSYDAKILCFGEGAMELSMHENAVFFLPVNTLTVWCTGFLGHTTHYCVYYTANIYQQTDLN